MKENIYNTVKKHDAEIDGLCKKVDDHEKRIETIETRSMATAPEQATQLPAPTITVSVPDNIATKENVTEATQEALRRHTEATERSVLLMADKMIEAAKAVPYSPGNAFDNKAYENVAEVAAKKTAEKVVAARYDKADKAYDHLMDRIYSLSNGAVWAAVPKWAYLVVAILLLGTIGFGYGFFYQMNQNSHLKEVEWQYRRMRTMYSTDADKQYLVNREKEFFTGSFHVQDSIKDNIRYWEKKSGVDKTFTYYAPTED